MPGSPILLRRIKKAGGAVTPWEPWNKARDAIEYWHKLGAELTDTGISHMCGGEKIRTSGSFKDPSGI